MVRMTQAGKVFVNTTIKPDALAELRKLGMSPGAAAENYLKSVEVLRQKNEELESVQTGHKNLSRKLVELDQEIARLKGGGGSE